MHILSRETDFSLLELKSAGIDAWRNFCKMAASISLQQQARGVESSINALTDTQVGKSFWLRAK